MAWTSALASEVVSTWQAKDFAEASAFPLYLTIPQTSLPFRAADSSGEWMAALGVGSIGFSKL